MKHKKIVTIITTFALASQMFAAVVFGQTVSTTRQSQKSTEKNYSSKYLQDIAQLVKEGNLNVSNGLEQETEKVEKALANSTKGVIITDRSNNKGTSVIENLAVRFDSENTPQSLRGKRILKLDLGAILADSKNVQEVEARIQDVLKQLEAFKENVLLYVEDASAFSKEAPVFGAEIANNLRKSLAEGNIRVISLTTAEIYNQEIVADVQIKNRFKNVDLSITESDDSFVGDKISPDLRELMASSNPNDKVKVILQSDDVNNPELLKILKLNNVTIENRVESFNILIVELPLIAAEQVAAVRGARHLSLDSKLATLGHIETTTGAALARTMSGNSTQLDGTGIGIAIVDSGVRDDHRAFTDDRGDKRISVKVDFSGDDHLPDDKFGHGTHVGSIAAGSAGKSGDNKRYTVFKQLSGNRAEREYLKCPRFGMTKEKEQLPD